MSLKMKIPVILLSLLGLGACATSAPYDLQHSTEDNTALVITVSKQGQQFLHRFKKLDPENSNFGDNVTFDVGKGWGSYLGGDDTVLGIAFNAKKVSPGHYAHVETAHSIISGYPYVTQQRIWRCYHDGASVYQFNAGNIYILPLERLDAEGNGATLNPDDVNKRFQEIRSEYPNISGSEQVAKPVSVISWPEEAAKSELISFVSKCQEPQSFTFKK